MGMITALEMQKRSKKRVNVYIDGVYTVSVSLDEAAMLHTGQILDETAIATLISSAAVNAAADSAARFLAMRPRSTREVSDYLLKRGTDPNVIEGVVARLSALGYLDDRAFARHWVQGRETFKPLSGRALRYELQRKGIDRALIDEALADVADDVSALDAARRHSRRLRGGERAAVRDKLVTHLLRKGFSYAIARSSVRELFEVIDADDPDFFASVAD